MTTRQSEMADPHSLHEWCTFDIIMLFFHNARLTPWRTLMAYSILSRNAEESFNRLLNADPDADHRVYSSFEAEPP